MCDSSKPASSFSPLGFSFCSRALGGERLLVDRRRAQGPHPYSYTSSNPDPQPQPDPNYCFRPLFDNDQDGFPDATDTTVRASLTFGASPTSTTDDEGNPGIVMANTTVLTYSEGSEDLLSFKWTDLAPLWELLIRFKPNSFLLGLAGRESVPMANFR